MEKWPLEKLKKSKICRGFLYFCEKKKRGFSSFRKDEYNGRKRKTRKSWEIMSLCTCTLIEVHSVRYWHNYKLHNSYNMIIIVKKYVSYKTIIGNNCEILAVINVFQCCWTTPTVQDGDRFNFTFLLYRMICFYIRDVTTREKRMQPFVFGFLRRSVTFNSHTV